MRGAEQEEEECKAASVGIRDVVTTKEA